MIFAPAFVAYFWLCVFGLPADARDWLLVQLRQRGIAAKIDHVHLDWFGGIIADKLVLYRELDQERVWLQVDRARVAIAWLSYLRGAPLVESIAVAGAHIRVPISEAETVDLDDVRAHINVRKNRLEVVEARANLLKLELLLRGNISIGGVPPSKPPTSEEIARREEIWRAVKQYAAELQSVRPVPLQLQFDFSTSDWRKGAARAWLLSRWASWRGVPISELQLEARLEDETVRLDQFRLKFSRGEFFLEGHWNTRANHAEASFHSDLDFTPLAPALDERWRPAIERLQFDHLPIVTGRCVVDWASGLKLDLQGEIDWKKFRYGPAEFQRLSLNLAFDGTRLIIPDAQLVSSAGAANFEMFWNAATPELKAKWRSDLDPTLFLGIFGEKMDRFLSSCRFPLMGPIVEASVTGTSLKTDGWKARGKLTVGDFSYKDIPFSSAESSFTLENSRLTLPDLVVKRPEGVIQGGLIYDFGLRTAEFKNFTSSVDVAAVAPALGPKFTGYVRPYRFSKPPNLSVSGVVDFQKEKPKLDTNLTVEVDAAGSMEWELLKINFVFGQPRGKVHVIDRRLNVTMHRSELFKGVLSGTLNVDISRPDGPYETEIRLLQADFDQLMQQMFHYKNTSGLFNGSAKLSGVLGQVESIKGAGEISVNEGYLTSIPFLGGLGSLISNIIPNFGYAKASRAKATFTVEKGFIASKDLEMTSTTFALIAEGRHNFVENNLDMVARVNMRGVFGLLLFPVSKLFEYRGKGPLNNVKWETENL